MNQILSCWKISVFESKKFSPVGFKTVKSMQRKFAPLIRFLEFQRALLKLANHIWCLTHMWAQNFVWVLHSIVHIRGLHYLSGQDSSKTKAFNLSFLVHLRFVKYRHRQLVDYSFCRCFLTSPNRLDTWFRAKFQRQYHF